MATGVVTGDIARENVEGSFDRLGGLCGILAGVGAFLYSVAFVLVKNATLYSLFQVAGGLLSTALFVALYGRLKSADGGLSLWSLLLVLVAAVGSAVHGAYDLANAVNPPKADILEQNNIPSMSDPRGFLTFAVAGLGVAALSSLMLRSGRFSSMLAYLGIAAGVLMVVTWLGRLIVLDANSLLILVPAALVGFILVPAWYMLAGAALLRPQDGARVSP